MFNLVSQNKNETNVNNKCETSSYLFIEKKKKVHSQKVNKTLPCASMS